MKRGISGKWIPESSLGRDFESFLPKSLPPSPSLVWGEELVTRLAKASSSVARLDGAARLLPDLHNLIYSYVRKEAVLSSQIEGTQSSISDLLVFESEGLPGVPIDDVSEVSRYVQALTVGVRRITSGEPISIALLLDLHKILLSTGRGSDKDPGSLRVTQNWVGGPTPDRAMFVPPSPANVDLCLNDLLNYWTSSKDHILIKAALIHLQFETIHPFRDGNGRIGRLLITLLLCQDKIISEPLVYLSLYLKEHRDEYYSKLQTVRLTGDWEDWIHFFLQGVTEVTDSAFQLTQDIRELFDRDLTHIRASGGRKSGSLLELYRAAQQSPIFSVPKAEKIINGAISRPTLYAAANELMSMNILTLVPNGPSATQLFAYTNYIQILNR